MKYNRHDLVYLKTDATEKVAFELASLGVEEELVFKFARKTIPLIVKQQPEIIVDKIELGVSFPKIIDGVRLRQKATVQTSSIEKLITPYQVAGNYPMAKEVEVLEGLGRSYGLTIGVFGSASLDVVTSYSYLHKASDIDVIFKGSTVSIEAFLQEYMQISASFNIKIDGEFYFRNVGSVKLTELASGIKIVMIKGLYHSFLEKRDRLIEKSLK